MSVPQTPDWLETPDLAITFLEFAAQDYAKSKAMRVYYAQAARAHGITYKQIGDIYGITGPAVQLMLKRAAQIDAADADLVDHDSLIYSTAYDSGFSAGRAFEQQQRDAQ